MANNSKDQSSSAHASQHASSELPKLNIKTDTANARNVVVDIDTPTTPHAKIPTQGTSSR